MSLGNVPPAAKPPARPAGAGFEWASVEEGSGRREYTKKQYEALPLSDRINLVLQKKVKFYRQGLEVSAAEAMRGV